MKIAVLLGGISPERNVSIAGGRAVGEALLRRGHSVFLVDPARGADWGIDPESISVSAAQFPAETDLGASRQRLLECVQSPLFNDIDMAFVLLHGKNGEDGIMQALLEARGVRYTGSKVLASALAMDKARSKMMFASAGITTPEWSAVYPNNYENIPFLQDVLHELGGKVIVKPNDGGSTVGMSIVKNDVDDFSQALKMAGKYAPFALVERFIEGRELTVAIIGDTALPIIEIAPEGGFYDYERKYDKGKTEYFCPADLSDDIRDFTQNLALTAHRVLDCTAYSRVDFRLDEDNVPWCLEVNTVPGFTQTSLVPMAAEAAGLGFEELCEKILQLS